jgi:hypothetical protein
MATVDRAVCEARRQAPGTLEAIRAAMLRHPQTSRTYKVLKAQRDALALAYGYCSAVLRAGAL